MVTMNYFEKNCKLYKTCKSRDCLISPPWGIELCYALDKLEKEGIVKITAQNEH